MYMRYDLILVCGPFKSGTSLLVEMLQEIGYFNPASTTNPTERAYGTTLPRYYTHECKQVRQINDSLVPSRRLLSNRRRIALFSSHRGPNPIDYLLTLKMPIAIKDPRLVYILPAWLYAANILNRKVCVCVTTRPMDDLLEAWRSAPFTRSLLLHNEHKPLLERSHDVIDVCRRWNVPYFEYSLDALRALKTEQTGLNVDRFVHTSLTPLYGRASG